MKREIVGKVKLVPFYKVQTTLDIDTSSFTPFRIALHFGCTLTKARKKFIVYGNHVRNLFFPVFPNLNR